jgi:multiple sugar transport system permease protein
VPPIRERAKPRPTRRPAARRRVLAAARWTGLGAVMLFFGFPIIWMVLTSLKERVLLYQPGRLLFPPTLENYTAALVKYGILDYVKNSLIVATGNTLLSLALGVTAAYGLSRFAFRGRETLALGILLARLFPTITLVIPFFVLAFLLHLLDTHLLLILIYLTFNVPFVVWGMRAYFQDIPKEIEEAALVDGCGRVAAFFRCILPAARPGLFATGVLCFILAWNEFNYALFLTSRAAKTVPTAIAFFRTERGILWGEVSALGVIAILPVLLIAALGHKVLLRGFSIEGSQR